MAREQAVQARDADVVDRDGGLPHRLRRHARLLGDGHVGGARRDDRDARPARPRGAAPRRSPPAPARGAPRRGPPPSSARAPRPRPASRGAAPSARGSRARSARGRPASSPARRRPRGSRSAARGGGRRRPSPAPPSGPPREPGPASRRARRSAAAADVQVAALHGVEEVDEAGAVHAAHRTTPDGRSPPGPGRLPRMADGSPPLDAERVLREFSGEVPAVPAPEPRAAARHDRAPPRSSRTATG